jgi:hypothetical protein
LRSADVSISLIDFVAQSIISNLSITLFIIDVLVLLELDDSSREQSVTVVLGDESVLGIEVESVVVVVAGVGFVIVVDDSECSFRVSDDDDDDDEDDDDEKNEDDGGGVSDDGDVVVD